jgi:hypothetical protein
MSNSEPLERYGVTESLAWLAELEPQPPDSPVLAAGIAAPDDDVEPGSAPGFS